MDLDPFEPAGISAQTMRFLDVFLLHCLLSESPPDSPEETVAMARNQHRTAAQGREAGLMLQRGESQVGIADWGAEILAECLPLAEALDQLGGTPARHMSAVEQALQRWQAPHTSPSARLLAAMKTDFGGAFHALALAQTHQSHAHWLAHPLAPEVHDRLRVAAEVSLREQRRREAADMGTFEEYRVAYLAPERLLP